MKKKALFIIATFLWLLIVTQGFAQVIDKVVAFGDSLSDNGNVYLLTLEAQKMVRKSPIIPDVPYYSGRFSNGPVWVENIAQALNVPLLDYAYGGAWAESFRDSHLLVPFDLRMQINFYLVHAVRDYNKDKHLFTIWIGANDYLSGRKDLAYATTNTVSKIQNALTALINYGAKYLLILNLPDLGSLPIVKQRALTYAKELTELAHLHNQKLVTMIDAEKKQHPDVHFMLLDVGAYYDEVRKNLEEQKDGEYQGVKNFRDACYNGGYYPGVSFVADEGVRALKKNTNLNVDQSPDLKVTMLTTRYANALRQVKSCEKPDEYFYWDLVHPSKKIHAKLTEIVLKMLATT